MNSNTKREKKIWDTFHGPNLGYVMELYEMYKKDPNSIVTDVREIFEKWGPPEIIVDEKGEVNPPIQFSEPNQSNKKVARAVKLADTIRSYGHLDAEINPVDQKMNRSYIKELEEYQLSEEDLKDIPVEIICPNAPEDVQNGLDAINHLKKLYTQSIAFELSHINDMDEKNWLNRMIESGEIFFSFSDQDRFKMLERLIQVEGFESFLHRTFVGQKRFSIEGLDTLVPMLDKIIERCVEDDTENVMIGMSHRGRLNVLAHTIGKPYELLFSEFLHVSNEDISSFNDNDSWTSDVKYHFGGQRKIKEGNNVRTQITLANNPSHLEFVNPVVLGFTRAAQEDRQSNGYPQQDIKKSIALLIHGDAAFPGQGVVAETLNLRSLKGYYTGGTIHIIANNNIGFTTESSDSRSTQYASDLAKGYGIPIIHVNADDPEACLAAVYLAYQYRKKFKKDFLIDLIGYRRYGHNEMDEPQTTQPLLYNTITGLESVRAQYEKKLLSKKLITAEKVNAINTKVQEDLQTAYEKVTAVTNEEKNIDPPEAVKKGFSQVNTGISKDVLREINNNLVTFPEEFNVYPKLNKILQRRSQAFEDGKVDWSLAETMAFATILKEGTPIRLTGQDTERGTFAHRNLILHDSKTDKVHCPLHTLSDGIASFTIHNSPLSEVSVVGFEYGYNVFSPETLVLWEAQFGDFANVAQVIYDQFLSSGRAKWGQKSGLVLLLPHGYEGQGPEHSSARLERFLQLSAENNWTVANLTTAAQYFHILRRQAKILKKETVRPLIIMTPKSLLRHPLTSSSVEDLTGGHFKPILEQPKLTEQPEKVERLILCSGKIVKDLTENLEGNTIDWLHIIRIEELYPFPKEEIQDVLGRLPNLREVIWLQEEPQNMGAWLYIQPRIHAIVPENVTVSYIGRPLRSSTAEGDSEVHKSEQARIINEALKMMKGVIHYG